MQERGHHAGQAGRDGRRYAVGLQVLLDRAAGLDHGIDVQTDGGQLVAQRVVGAGVPSHTERRPAVRDRRRPVVHHREDPGHGTDAVRRRDRSQPEDLVVAVHALAQLVRRRRRELQLEQHAARRAQGHVVAQEAVARPPEVLRLDHGVPGVLQRGQDGADGRGVPGLRRDEGEPDPIVDLGHRVGHRGVGALQRGLDLAGQALGGLDPLLGADQFQRRTGLAPRPRRRRSAARPASRRRRSAPPPRKRGARPARPG